MQAPTGWVTLVFTDIQGSTALWERLGDAFQPVLDVHDATMRAVIAENGGYEVKTEGDAFMIAFTDVASAVRCCLAAQDALHAADWPPQVLGDPVFRGVRVRMGIHCGDPLCRPDPVTGRMDYYGRMVNRAARVGAAGHGGQIVLSSAAYAEMGPVDAVITDLGYHALKGFEGRERLWQLTPRRLAQHIFPPPRTLDVRRTNLPAQVSTFVGRGPEFQQIEKLLNNGSRLITLVGPGGAGKTRLALRVAGELLADFPGGVWFCDVGNARSVDAACAALAAGFGLHLAGPEPVGRISDALAASERVLLVLDDADGLTQLAADTLDRWLEDAPGAHFILTARAPIGRMEEQVVPVGPLPVPTRTDPPVKESPAMALFLSRPAALRPDFQVDDDALPDLVDIVRYLRGLPLAVELAGVRLERESPASLKAAVGAALAEVETSEDAIEAVLVWAWAQVRDWERTALEQLAVFAGGFTADAAEAVLDLHAFPSAPPVIDVLRGLSEQALLRPLGDDRWTLPVSLSTWLDERIGTGARQSAERRHAAWYARLGDDGFFERLEREGTAARWRSFLAERDNLLVAMRRATFLGEVDLAARCVIALLIIFDVRGPVSAGTSAAGPILARSDLPPALEVRLLHRLARLERQAGRSEQAVALLERAQERAKAHGDRRFEGIILNTRATVSVELGRPDDAMRFVQQALSTHRAEANRRYEGIALGHLGSLHQARQEWVAAEQSHRDALTLLTRTGDRRFHAVNLGMLGRLHAQQGKLGEARGLYQEAIEVHRALGNERHEAMALLELGEVFAEMNDAAEAVRQLEAALPLYRTLGGPAGAAMVHRNLALLLLDAKETGDAMRHYETGLALLGRNAEVLARAQFDAVRAEFSLRSGKLDEAEELLGACLPVLTTHGDVAGRAECLARLLRAALARGRRRTAERHADEVRPLLEQLKTVVRARVQAALAMLEAELEEITAPRAIPPRGESAAQ
ncbi:MAG: hypothetical protein RLZZ299_226 [Pseudomonadota bacterium]